MYEWLGLVVKAKESTAKRRQTQMLFKVNMHPNNITLIGSLLLLRERTFT